MARWSGMCPLHRCTMMLGGFVSSTLTACVEKLIPSSVGKRHPRLRICKVGMQFGSSTAYIPHGHRNLGQVHPEAFQDYPRLEGLCGTIEAEAEGYLQAAAREKQNKEQEAAPSRG